MRTLSLDELNHDENISEQDDEDIDESASEDGKLTYSGLVS